MLAHYFLNNETTELIKTNNNCTGCGACENICPKDAIQLDYDGSGFLKPVVNEAVCIECKQCVFVCPTLKENPCKTTSVEPDEKFVKPDCYAAWAEDEIRMQSSSGGVFTVAAKAILRKKGWVYGVAWEDGFVCVHKGIHEADKLSKLQYSKYIQSETRKCFRKVKEYLKAGEQVLYVGRPCQIAGLRSYLGELAHKDHLIMMDLLCFYAPSAHYFRKYLDESYGIGNIKEVLFRNKKRGWTSSAYTLIGNNEEEIYPNPKEDAFLRMFQSALGRNDVCDCCRFADFPRQGDLTMGDFWGIEQHDPTWNDKKGTSLLIANTQKGKQFLEQIRSDFKRIEQVPLNWCLNKGNRIGKDGLKRHPNQKYYEKLLQEVSVSEAVDMALKNKHDIGLVCIMNHNYGNNLTNYALYQYLCDLGKRVMMIDLPKNVKFVLPKDRSDRMELFLEPPYPVYDLPVQVEYKQDLMQFNSMCDVFMVGSDQIWRSMFVEGTDFYTCLDWVEPRKYKMSYGTSFGVGTFEKEGGTRKKFEMYLKRFQKISVREESGCALLKNEFDIDSVCVLDPVWMCDRSHYEVMASKGMMRIPKGSFIGSYMLDPDREKESAIQYLSERYCSEAPLVIYDAMEHADGTCDEISLKGMEHASVEEWLAVILSCEFFITDSFHGVCFALIFQKKFCAIYQNSWRGIERIQNILGKLGLEDRLLTEPTNEAVESLYRKEIDYDTVNKILDRERALSDQWLREALEEQKSLTIESSSAEEQERMLKEIYKGRHELYLAKKEAQKNMVHVKEGDKKSMEMIGWGTGGSFRRNIDKVKEYSDIRYVVDSRPDKWGKQFADTLTCISPEQLKEMKNVTVLIMVDSTVSAFQIVEQLMGMGIYSFEYVDNYLKFIESLD